MTDLEQRYERMSRGYSKTLMELWALRKERDHLIRQIDELALLLSNTDPLTPEETYLMIVRRLSDSVRLREQVKTLKRQLTMQREHNHERNLELDALHHVWCDGGCESGVHRWSSNTLTEEVVALAERNTRRLRRWWNIRQWRAERARQVAEGAEQ